MQTARCKSGGQAARSLSADEIRSKYIQDLIGHMRDTVRDAPGVGLFPRLQRHRDTLQTPFHRNVCEQGLESEISAGAEDRLRAGWT